MEVELPNGQIAEFPDSMDVSQIESVLQKQFISPKGNTNIAPQQSANEMGYSPGGLEGIGRDIAESTLSAPGAALQSLMRLPEHVGAGAEYSKKEPWYKSAGQLGIGGVEGVAGLLSAPQVGGRYLAEKFSTPESSVYKGLHETPTPFELLRQYEAKGGVAPTKKGEEELRALGQLLLSRKMPFIPSKAGRIGVTAASVAGQGGDPIHAALGAVVGEKAAKLPKKVPEWVKQTSDKYGLEDKILKSEEELADSESSLKTAQAQAGGKSPEGLKVKSKNLEQKINELTNNLEKMTPKNGAITNPKAMIPNLSHETNLQNAAAVLEEAKGNTNEAHKMQAMQLGAGQNFRERASPLIHGGVEEIKSSIRPLYTSVDQDLINQNVMIPNTDRATQVRGEVDRLINKGILAPESDAIYDRILQQFIEKLPGNEFDIVPASEFVQMYKSARDLARIARSRSREGGIPQDQRKRWELQANALEPIVANQRQLLKDSIPKDTYNNLINADKQWGKRVIPFYNNAVYREVMKEGRAPENMISKTIGTNEHNQIMQQLIQSNPELNRLALGQQYSEKPHELLTYNEMTEPYIAAHQPTQRLAEVQRRALEQLEKTKNIHTIAEQRATEISGNQKAIAEKVKTEEIERQKLTTEIDKLKSDFKTTNENIQKLEIEIKKYGQSKARNEELKKYKKDKDQIKSKLWGVASSGLGYLLGKNVIDSMFRVLFK